MREYHIQCGPGDVGHYVLLPGDPGRCALIAERFSDARLVASNREFTTYTGVLDGEMVTVTSTGIGGPSAAIAVEELVHLGARRLLRVGTCGALQERVAVGDLIVVTAAARGEGTSAAYVPSGYPAVADPDTVAAVHDEARARGLAHHRGLVVSNDAFYAEAGLESLPRRRLLAERWEEWRLAGVLAVEMECATVLVTAALRGAAAGAVLAVIDRAGDAMPALEELRLDALVDTATGAMRHLIALDRT